jgi:hypothetical protein
MLGTYYCINDTEYENKPLVLEGFPSGDRFGLVAIDLIKCQNKSENAYGLDFLLIFNSLCS